MTKRGAAVLRAVTLLFAGTAAWGQSGNPGAVNFLEYAQSNFDPFTANPTAAQEQWMRNNFAAMVVWSPYFDNKTSWYPNAYVYQDLYAIYVGSALQYDHPEWILKDQYGNWLYIPFACYNGACSQWAGDVSNPAFRAYWISEAQTQLAQGNYPGLFVDDVNMNFNVSDGYANLVAPIDSNTGQPMTYTAWRSYIATFTQEIRAALPNTKIIHNAIWYAGPSPTYSQDPYIQAELQSANTINLERGIASDGGLTGGTGFWSVYNFFSYVDMVHGLGNGVNYEEYTLDSTGLQYGLAGYFLVSNGNDFISDQTSTPDNWYNGYQVNLGSPLGARTYNNGIFERLFSNGMVVLAEPGLGTTTVQLPEPLQNLSGQTVTSVTLSGSEGAVFTGNPVPPANTPNLTQALSPITSVSRSLTTIAPSYTVNGYGPVQINLNTGGGPLSIDGVPYTTGLGVNAYAEEHWALNGNCTSLSATVGVDSTVPSWLTAVNVNFQIWADGLLLWQSGFMHGWSPAQSFNVNLTGYQTLALVTTNGIWMAPSWTTYNDSGDWVNPILTCNN